MTSKAITKISRVKKPKIVSNSATLAIWQSMRGLLKKHKILPVQYQRSTRKERSFI